MNPTQDSATPGEPIDPRRRRKTIEERMAEQGITGPQDIEDLMGDGTDMFRDDEEFERFLDWLRETRRTGR